MKRCFCRSFTTASAGDMAEASSSCADSSDVMLISGTVLAVSVFLAVVLSVRISVLVLVMVLSSVLVLRDQNPQVRLKTQMLTA